MSFICGKGLPSGTGMIVFVLSCSCRLKLPIQYVCFLLGVSMESPIVFKGCDTTSILLKELYVRLDLFFASAGAVDQGPQSVLYCPHTASMTVSQLFVGVPWFLCTA